MTQLQKVTRRDPRKTVTLTTDDLLLIINALEYFQRDVDDGEDLTSGGEEVDSTDIDKLLELLGSL